MMLPFRLRRASQISLFCATLFVTWALRATFFYSLDERISSELLRVAYSQFVKLLLWVAPAFGFAYFFRHSPPMRYLGLSAFPSREQWLSCFGAIGIFLALVIGFETFVGKKTVSLSGHLVSITAVGAVLISPMLEEVLFRGLVLNEFTELMSSWSANLLTSVLFVGIHLPFWLSHLGPTRAVLADAVGIFFFSLLAGWVYLRSRSIWPPVCAHILNNTVAQLLAGAKA